MPDEPKRSPSNDETDMAANAQSSVGQGQNADRDRHKVDASIQAADQIAEPSADRLHGVAKHRGDDEGTPPSIVASQARSAELLREASELLAGRTNDA